MSRWTLVLTGTGTSHGNPLWGHREWWSEDPRDHRRRSGAMLLADDGRVVLIDLGPDLAYQLRDPFRRWDGVCYPEDCIMRCDGVLLTHDHADHCHGLNELRQLNRLMRGAEIVIHGHASHLQAVRGMFPYAFVIGPEAYHLGKPSLLTRAQIDGQPFAVAGLPLVMVPLDHGPAGRVSGFRCGPFAYLTDMKLLPAASDQYLQNLDLLVMNVLRDEPHATHQCWAEAMAVLARLRPRRTVLTHVGPEVRFAAWADRLSPTLELAVDGWHASLELPDAR